MSTNRFPAINVRLDDREIRVFTLNGVENLNAFLADVRSEYQASVAQSQRFSAAKKPQEQYAYYQNGGNISFLVARYPIIEVCDVENGRTANSKIDIREGITAVRAKLHDINFAKNVHDGGVSFPAAQDNIPFRRSNPNDPEVQKAKIIYGFKENEHYRQTVSDEQWNEYEKMQKQAQQPEPAEDVLKSAPR